MPTIVQQSQGNLSVGARVDFRKPDFDTIIEKKGYDVVYRKAIKCPCKSVGSSNQSNCKNCGGSGWLWINPVRTRMVMQSMNFNYKYQEYGDTLLGTVSVTAKDVDRLCRMDEIKIESAEAENTEVLHLTTNSVDDVFYAYTHYEIISESYVALFDGVDQPLQKLEKGIDYTLSGRKITLDATLYDQAVLNDLSLCIRYLHNPLYYVWEVGRDIMSTPVLVGKSEEIQKLPLHATAMRADLIKDLENYDGNRLIDNSFLTQCTL